MASAIRTQVRTGRHCPALLLGVPTLRAAGERLPIADGAKQWKAGQLAKESGRDLVRTAAQVIRSAGGCCMGAVVGMAVFGLTLGMLTLPAFAGHPGYQVAATLVAAALGFAVGGFTAGALARRQWALHGGIFGLSLGLFSFTYVLGPSWAVLPAGLAASALGYGGGWLAGELSGGPLRQHP